MNEIHAAAAAIVRRYMKTGADAEFNDAVTKAKDEIVAIRDALEEITLSDVVASQREMGERRMSAYRSGPGMRPWTVSVVMPMRYAEQTGNLVMDFRVSATDEYEAIVAAKYAAFDELVQAGHETQTRRRDWFDEQDEDTQLRPWLGSERIQIRYVVPAHCVFLLPQ